MQVEQATHRDQDAPAKADEDEDEDEDEGEDEDDDDDDDDDDDEDDDEDEDEDDDDDDDDDEDEDEDDDDEDDDDDDEDEDEDDEDEDEDDEDEDEEDEDEEEEDDDDDDEDEEDDDDDSSYEEEDDDDSSEEDGEEDEVDDSHSAAEGKRSRDQRLVQAGRKKPRSAPVGLSNIRAKVCKPAPTAPTTSTTSTAPQRSGIDLSILDNLRGAGRRFGKLFQLANDPNAPEGERANAQKKVDEALAKKDDDVLAALKVLQEAAGKPMGDVKPGLVQVDILVKEAPAKTKNKWMSTLAYSIATQYLIKNCAYSHPTRYGFYGNEALAVAAADDYAETFNWLTSVAPDHAFAQGFADEHWRIQFQLMEARNQADAASKAEEMRGRAATPTAVVVRTNKELAEEAEVAFVGKVTKGRKMQGASRTNPNYERGREAARSRHEQSARDRSTKLA